MITAYTPEEIQTQLIEHFKMLAKYWAELPDKTPKDRCDGLAFSILNIFDGTTAVLPAFDIVAKPHPDDKDFNIKNGERYYEDGTVVNNCYLHDLYY